LGIRVPWCPPRSLRTPAIPEECSRSLGLQPCLSFLLLPSLPFLHHTSVVLTHAGSFRAYPSFVAALPSTRPPSRLAPRQPPTLPSIPLALLEPLPSLRCTSLPCLCTKILLFDTSLHCCLPWDAKTPLVLPPAPHRIFHHPRVREVRSTMELRKRSPSVFGVLFHIFRPPVLYAFLNRKHLQYMSTNRCFCLE